MRQSHADVAVDGGTRSNYVHSVRRWQGHGAGGGAAAAVVSTVATAVPLTTTSTATTATTTTAAAAAGGEQVRVPPTSVHVGHQLVAGAAVELAVPPPTCEQTACREASCIGWIPGRPCKQRGPHCEVWQWAAGSTTGCPGVHDRASFNSGSTAVDGGLRAPAAVRLGRYAAPNGIGEGGVLARLACRRWTGRAAATACGCAALPGGSSPAAALQATVAGRATVLTAARRLGRAPRGAASTSSWPLPPPRQRPLPPRQRPLPPRRRRPTRQRPLPPRRRRLTRWRRRRRARAATRVRPSRCCTSGTPEISS